MTRSVSNFVEGAGEVAAKTTRQERASVQSNGVIRNAELAGSPLREPSLVSKYTVPMSGQQRSSFSTVTFPTSPVPPVRSTFLKGSMKAKPRTRRYFFKKMRREEGKGKRGRGAHVHTVLRSGKRSFGSRKLRHNARLLHQYYDTGATR